MTEKRVATFYDYVRLVTEQCNKASCGFCPLSSQNNEFHVGCGKYITEHTEVANEMLLKWIDEHPIKTYADDFFEHFPNALKHHENYPRACRQYIYGGECNIKTCLACWNQPYEESEDEE